MGIKNFIFILLLIPIFCLAGDLRKYEYKVEGLRGDLEKSGTISIQTLSKENKKYELVTVELAADWGKDNFSTEHLLNQDLVIYDIKQNKQPQGYSIFAPYINLKNYPIGYSTKLITLIDRRQPHFGDTDWVFRFEIKRIDKLLIGQKTYEAIYSVLWGNRPSGFSQNCPIKSGNVGEIRVETWHSLVDNKIVKQVFHKYGCVPTKNSLTKATLLLKN
jgi:hypothetical protein